MTDAITIPDALKPADGRFGAGPSKIRVDALAGARRHRQLADGHQPPPGAGQGHRRPGARRAWRSCSRLPEGYEVVLGNGGATAFWDIATFGLIRERSQHLSFGEFSSKFAKAAQQAPFLGDPTVIKSEPGHPPGAAGRGRASTPTPGRTTRPRPP